MNAYDTLGNNLHAALGRRIARHKHRLRVLRVSVLSVTLAGVLSTAALASDVLPGLELDPTKWEILERGEVDGQATYVNARDRTTGDRSTFLEERDAGLDRYDAFLLHRRTLAAAGASLETGPVCTVEQLTGAEIAALETVATRGRPGLAHDTAAADVTAALQSFGCSGTAYAGERARWVYALDEPVEMLMPGARSTARRLLAE